MDRLPERVAAIFNRKYDDLPSLPEFDANLMALGYRLRSRRRRNWIKRHFGNFEDDSFIGSVRNPQSNTHHERRLWPLGGDTTLYVDRQGRLVWHGDLGELEQIAPSRLSNNHRRKATAAINSLLKEP